MATTGAGSGGQTPDREPRSVYQRALGADFALLATGLQRYFGPIPAGSVGVGTGTFQVAGSRARWLRPALALMAARHILFPELEHDVSFSITNLPERDSSLSAIRTLHLTGRDRVMEDTMSIGDGHLIDRLGKRRGLEVALDVTVHSGGLHMRSRGLALRLAGVRVPLPRLATVHLDERADPADPTRQQVDVRITAPLVGEIFRYVGDFTYDVRPASTA